MLPSLWIPCTHSAIGKTTCQEKQNNTFYIIGRSGIIMTDEGENALVAQRIECLSSEQVIEVRFLSRAQNMWFVYIVKCADGSFYTGITNNVERRVKEHNQSNTVGSKYIRTRRPVTLVYSKKIRTRSEALKREFEIKHLSRETKEKLIFLGP